MQWLVDLVIEAIGIPPVFIDRGDPPDLDFEIGDLNVDGAWYTLDLSSIIPDGAKAVLFRLVVTNDEAERKVEFVPYAATQYYNASVGRTTVGGVRNESDMVCALGYNRQLEYRFTWTGWTRCDFVVKGWWL